MASSHTLSAGAARPTMQPPAIPTGPVSSIEQWRVYDLPKVRYVSDPSLAGLIVHQQRHFNDGALIHPTLVYDSYMLNGELIARCLQVTSWRGGQLVQEKQKPTSGAWYMPLQYVAIDH